MIWITQLDPRGSGPRLAVKDLFDTAGVRTTYGSAVYADHVPDETADAVQRLERAGYVTAGKANLHEFAWGITSENPHYGTVPNPLAKGRIAGGSSGGCAAAIAAGLADAGLGTDTGGSIRIPSACCGTTGFKPTFGLVSLEGAFPLAETFDHAGPMASDVDSCERMMDALVSQFEHSDLATLSDVRVGVAWTELAEPLVRARVEAAAGLFPHGRSLELPLPDALVTELFQYEAAGVHAGLWQRHPELYGDNVATKVRAAMEVSDGDAEAAARGRALYRERIAELMEPVDLVVTPTLVCVAPPTGIGDLALRPSLLRLTFPWNAVGAPALALPCGAAEDGLPASAQLIGRPGADGLVLAAGRLLEAALGPNAARAPRGT